ncbi:hypothetical protein D3C76_805800 [compost metagenome]|uniref:Uncharacterized protein n=1 Tax=Pseudomonas corrugata TaxID=47879 RepID=A0A8B6URK4_9PSED|nr:MULTISPECIES: hypothetical protein [Pseudomonas]QTH14531.1 hypothetical protein C4C32_01055 [Pseudomonas corrugata]CRM21428.1 hypothetical protein [Pseudomonas sp. 8 R 14]SAM30484.1 hypothetical protein BN1864_LIB5394:00531 [Pseudomonas sp. 1 R 17]
MDKDVLTTLEANEPLMTSALDTLRHALDALQQTLNTLKQYQDDMDSGLPAAELETLRLAAEALFQAISAYQLLVICCPSPTLQ